MPHPLGANIGGVRTVEDVRLRCVCDPDSGCWHLRTAHGRPMPVGQVHRLWVHGIGATSITRWVWEQHHGAEAPPRRIVYRGCSSYDCVNPEHLRCGTAKQRDATRRGKGRFDTPEHRRLYAEKARRAAEMGRARAQIAPELRQWIAASPQSNVELSHVLGIGHQRIATIRREAKARAGQAPASVFAWAQSMARAA